MFHLADTTRRQWTLALFVLVCLAPTVLLTLIGLWRLLPGRTVAEQRRLSLLLGQPVAIEAFHQPRPGIVVYEDLKVLDPENGQTLAQCDRVRAQIGSIVLEGEQAERTQLQVSIPELTIHTATPTAIRPLIDRLLQRRVSSHLAQVNLTARKLTVSHDQTAFALAKLQSEIILRREASQLDATFQLADANPAEPARLRIVRNCQIHPAADGFDLTTGAGTLPCPLLATLLPPIKSLGAKSSFGGYLVATHTSRGWEGEAQGKFDHVDMQALVADRLPHEMTGTGTLDLEHVWFYADRLLGARGSLRSVNGRVSYSLPRALAAPFGLLEAFPDGGSATLPYAELAFRFYFDEQGLQLRGDCGAEPSGVVLDCGYLQLRQPAADHLPVSLTATMSALTDTPPEELAISPRAVWLMERLPLLPEPAIALIAAPADETVTAQK